MKVFNPEGVKDLEGLIEERFKSVKEIEIVKLNETGSVTQLLVFIRTTEEPHYHAEHDLTFTVVSVLLAVFSPSYDGKDSVKVRL